MKMKGRIEARYERVRRTTKDPIKALNAVDEPTYMAPRIVLQTPQAVVALNGFL